MKSPIFEYLKKISKNYNVVYISGDLLKLRIKNYYFLIEQINKLIDWYLNENITIISPSFSKNFSDFSRKKMHLMSSFSKIILKRKKTLRSSHPLSSFVSIGTNARKILYKVPPNAYGFDSVFCRLKKYKTLYITFGDLENSFSLVHYCEMLCGVPYRFIKEFIYNKKFYYSNVLYKSNKIIRDKNKKIVKKILSISKVLKIKKINKGLITFSDYNNLIKITSKIISKNPKIWLRNEIKQNDYYYENKLPQKID